MRRPTGSGDDHPQTAIDGSSSVLNHLIGHPMR
jgi:hypothetical protein